MNAVNSTGTKTVLLEWEHQKQFQHVCLSSQV